MINTSTFLGCVADYARGVVEVDNKKDSSYRRIVNFMFFSIFRLFGRQKDARVDWSCRNVHVQTLSETTSF